MAQTLAYDSVGESVSEGGSLSSKITLSAERADTAYVYVDNQSGGSVSESYALTLEVEKALPHDSNTDSFWTDIEVGISGSTAKFHRIGEIPPSMQARLDLTNESDSGSSQDYRVVFETVVEGEN